MEIINLIAVISLGIFAETSYLVAKTLQPSKTRGGMLLDTSVLIDGRIVAIARSGLVNIKLIVPRSVVRELQFMADRADHAKRERARFGLDVIDELQNIDGLQLVVIEDGVTSQQGVDEQLIDLAIKWQAKLCTIDYNLNKSARVQNVRVVNINELAHALRVVYLPGEVFEVKLQQPGQDSHQAVGYMDDGTMVVVDNAKTFIGKTLKVEATRVLQTAAGKMMFAKHHEKVATKSIQRQKKNPVSVAKTGSKTGNHSSRANNKRNNKPKTAEDSLVSLANR